MRFLLRTLALLLVLMTGGVFQTLAFASDTHADCEEETGSGDCSDCATDCALCLCCPLRAAPAPLPFVSQVEEPLVRPPIHVHPDVLLPGGVGRDIFQPPRA
jgi:hypothetical protein